MEVHHHPHVEKKSFKEYLLEGLMIFLAVSMGFIAESTREYFGDREREQLYIESLVRDLKADTASIRAKITRNLRKEKALDSLILISSSDLSNPENSKKFVEYFIKGVGIPKHLPNTSAINQLKSTGSLRLLSHKKGVADSILKFDAYNELIIQHNEGFTNSQNGVWEAIYPLLDIKILRDTSYTDFFQGSMTGKQTPPLHLSQERLNIFLGHETRHALYNEVNRGYLVNQLQRATRLIEFLEKDYHLEKE